MELEHGKAGQDRDTGYLPQAPAAQGDGEWEDDGTCARTALAGRSGGAQVPRSVVV